MSGRYVTISDMTSTPTDTTQHTIADRTVAGHAATGDQLRFTVRAEDQVSVVGVVIRMFLFGSLAATLTLVAWFAMKVPDMPSFSNSYVLRALSTGGSVILLAAIATASYRWLHRVPQNQARHDQPPQAPSGTHTNRRSHHNRTRGWETRLLQATLYLAPALLVITTLGVPLAATRLYLEGVSVDQAFRTQFLTRMTEQLGWQDMAYEGLPSAYPGLWFATGGLFAKLTGMSGWEIYQPWAIITFSAATAILIPVWQRITGSLPLASALTTATVLVTLFIGAEEPYAALTAMGMPPALLLTRRALTDSRTAALALMIYLGISANLYTLFTAVSALIAVFAALILAQQRRTPRPILQLMAVGIGSLTIAALGWGPYLYALATKPHGPTGKAQHFLPLEGVHLPAPFLESPLLAVLGLITVMWIVYRFHTHTAQVYALGLAVCYGWALLSMLITALGTTLLGFRVELPIALMLATGAVLAIAEYHRSRPLHAVPELRDGTAPHSDQASTSRQATAVLAIVAAALATHFVAAIPTENQRAIDLAYSDTDGNAERADRYPADATTYYAKIHELITARFGAETNATVLTDEQSFMAFYPYYGFQAITAHYANPVGQFETRNEAIGQWAETDTPQQFLEALETTQAEHGWRSPNVFLLRGQLELKESDEELANLPEGQLPTVVGTGDGTFSYRIAEDIYPNSPNVRFNYVSFHANIFSEGWDLHQVGPFVLALRHD